MERRGFCCSGGEKEKGERKEEEKGEKRRVRCEAWHNVGVCFFLFCGG